MLINDAFKMEEQSCELRAFNLEEKNIEVIKDTKLYKRRWLILFIYVLYSASNAMQWLEYCIIINIVKKYYNISDGAVDWTSMVTMITYAPFLIPSSYITYRKGLRAAVVCGTVMTAIGTWLKVFSLQPHLFWISLLGQTIMFASQPLILSLPPHIAAIWFGENEVSTACAIGVFGSQFGTAIGFVLPTILVHDHKDIEDIGVELSYMFYGYGILTLLVLMLVFAFFSSHPKLPPSNTQAEERSKHNDKSLSDFFNEYRILFRNKPFLLLIVSFGINIAVFYGICTLFNDFILTRFPNSEKDAGLMGILMIILGMIGSIAFGYILDKTRKYKEITLFVYLTSTLSIIAFMISLNYSKLYVYLTVCIMGFFLNSYTTVAFEFGTEITFPQAESTSAGVLLSTAQSFGVIFILMFRAIFYIYGSVYCIVTATVLMSCGTMMTYLIKNDLKRQAAFKSLSTTNDKFIHSL